MLKSYFLLSKCEHELEDCVLSQTQKMDLVSNIFRVKMAILNNNHNSDNMTKFEDEIRCLYNDICALCDSSSKSSDAEGLIIRLHNILKLTNKQQE